MAKPRSSRRLLVYALLIGGSIFFSLPFLWMAATSVKVDSELFRPGLNLFPSLPDPKLTSPHVDSRRLQDIPEVPADLAAPLGELVAELAKDFAPTDLPRETWLPPLTHAVYGKLRDSLPADAWNEPPEEFIRTCAAALSSRTVRELFENQFRQLCIGPVRARSVDLEETVLGGKVPPAERFQNETPDVVQLTDHTQGAVRYASLAYDFHKGDTISLTQDFDLGFDPAKLERFQLYLKPDDTWHELDLTLEANGIRYKAERVVPLANYNWTMVTWQKPGPDDNSTKIKTWILLHPDKKATNAFSEPGKIRVSLTIRRSSYLNAVAAKFALNYLRVMEHIPFWRYVRVSIFLVLVNVILTVFACSLIAYAFARLNWPGRDFCFLLMLATLMIPGQVTMIPHFLIWKYVGAYNTLTPLWLGRAFGNAFFVFLLRQFLKGIPRDLEDAARIDGCGTFRIYWHLMLPLMKPSLAAIAIFTFMGTWNDFMGPLIYLADQRLYPLAFGLYAFSVQVGNNPALTMAGSLLMTLPVIVIFFFAQKYFIQGVTLTGMKG
jgi:multiple sugar transport system permease protein